MSVRRSASAEACICFSSSFARTKRSTGLRGHVLFLTVGRGGFAAGLKLQKSALSAPKEARGNADASTALRKMAESLVRCNISAQACHEQRRHSTLVECYCWLGAHGAVMA